VIDEGSDVEADLVIAPRGTEIELQGEPRTIWLRAEPEAANRKDNSIYRYDRAGLLTALRTAAGGGR
jgi:two-component system chemotaxis sensor kinase CheA